MFSKTLACLFWALAFWILFLWIPNTPSLHLIMNSSIMCMYVYVIQCEIYHHALAFENYNSEDNTTTSLSLPYFNMFHHKIGFWKQWQDYHSCYTTPTQYQVCNHEPTSWTTLHKLPFIYVLRSCIYHVIL